MVTVLVLCCSSQPFHRHSSPAQPSPAQHAAITHPLYGGLHPGCARRLPGITETKAAAYPECPSEM